MDKRLTNYIEDFIIKKINKKKLLFLSKDLLIPRNELDRTYSYYEFVKLNINDKDAHLFFEKRIKIIEEYLSYLRENSLQRSFNKTRSLINNYINNSNSNISIKNGKYLYLSKFVNINVIESLNDYLNYLSVKVKISETNKHIYFRGHSNINWNLLPGIFRDEKLLFNEKNIYNDIIIRNPKNFVDQKSTFDRLTIMQHYGLPTRLLDITKNPLVALYFASDSNVDYPGEVIIFKTPLSKIKYFDSDTVSILSNLVHLKKDEFMYYETIQEFNEFGSGKELSYLIKNEKPFFSSRIDPKDLKESWIVKPINNNERIKRQQGFFILFGIGKNIYKPSNAENLRFKLKKIEILLIAENQKRKIIEELNLIGINKETLFPEIEYGAKYIKERYSMY